MYKTALSVIVYFVVGLTACASLRAGSDQSIVAWDSPEGINRLESASAKTDFFKLANQFESQSNKIYCGPTTGAIVLNALRVKNNSIQKPRNVTIGNQYKKTLPPKFDPNFRRYSQENFFSKAATGVKSRAHVFGRKMKGSSKPDYGLQLRQLSEMLRAHGVDVKLRVVSDDVELDTVREELASNLNNPGDYVIVNYARKSLEQEGGGHISPVGAYDKGSDSFLVMDVNPNKAGWVWVKAQALVEAMRTFDTTENRGYLLVQEGS